MTDACETLAGHHDCLNQTGHVGDRSMRQIGWLAWIVESLVASAVGEANPFIEVLRTP